MHRSVGAAALATVIASAVIGSGVVAQTERSISEVHPFVGVWVVDTNTDDATEPSTRLVVHPDGSLLQVDHSTVAIGVWEPAGDHEATLTITAQVEDDGGEVTEATLRGEVVLDPAGDAWTAEATVEFVDQGGATSGQMGPIPAAATRVLVEPMVPAASPGF